MPYNFRCKMRRVSRQISNPKVVTPDDIQRIQDESDEEAGIDKKLKESGILEEGLTLDQRSKLYNSVQASIRTAKFEEHRRNSGKLGNTRTKEFNSDSEDSNSGADELKVVGGAELSIVFDSTPPKVQSKSIIQTLKKKAINLVGGAATFMKPLVEVKHDQVKSVEDEDVIQCDSNDSSADEGFTPTSKKRPSPNTQIVSAKKIKKDCSTNMECLQFELEFKQSCNTSLWQRRSHSEISAEFDGFNERWKAAVAKYRLPIKWSQADTNIKNKKWSGGHIPTQLMNCFKQCLAKHNQTHPLFCPTIDDVTEVPSSPSEPNEDDIEVVGQYSPCVVEESKYFKSTDDSNVNKSSTSISCQNVVTPSPPTVDEYNLFEKDEEKDTKLKNEDEEWFSVGSNKSKGIAAKNGKYKNGSQKQAGRVCKDDEPSKIQTVADNPVPVSTIVFKPRMRTRGVIEVEKKRGAASDNTMACPICSKLFSERDIEDHGRNCADKAFKD